MSYFERDPEQVARLDLLARNAGMSRSGFIRAAVHLADSSLVVAQLERLERQVGLLTPEQADVLLKAKRGVVDVLADLCPAPIIPMDMSPN
jgi:hypothetical protein